MARSELLDAAPLLLDAFADHAPQERRARAPGRGRDARSRPARGPDRHRSRRPAPTRPAGRTWSSSSRSATRWPSTITRGSCRRISTRRRPTVMVARPLPPGGRPVHAEPRRGLRPADPRGGGQPAPDRLHRAARVPRAGRAMPRSTSGRTTTRPGSRRGSSGWSTPIGAAGSRGTCGRSTPGRPSSGSGSRRSSLRAERAPRPPTRSGDTRGARREIHWAR